MANAGIVVYSGYDVGIGAAGPWTNSNAAAAAYDAAAPGSIITFESAPLGPFASLNAAPGVTVTGSDFFGGDQTIINSPICTDYLCGYNTTAGGSQWLSMSAGSATFTFNSPITSFGAYISGIQVAGMTLDFTDAGGPESVAIPDTAMAGGIAFVGFLDTSSFTSVTINANSDIIGVDDVRYGGGGGPGVPEPATFGLLGAALVGLGLLRRRLA